MTHGEAYVFKRNNLDFKQNIDKIARLLERLPKRMSRNDALNYYGNKLRKVFGVEEVERRDFLKVDHYFDYFEAKKLLRRIN